MCNTRKTTFMISSFRNTPTVGHKSEITSEAAVVPEADGIFEKVTDMVSISFKLQLANHDIFCIFFHLHT